MQIPGAVTLIYTANNTYSATGTGSIFETAMTFAFLIFFVDPYVLYMKTIILNGVYILLYQLP